MPILATIDDFIAGRITGASLLRSQGYGRRRGGLGGILSRNPRFDFQDPAQSRTANVRRLLPLLLAPMAFFSRWFMSRWREAGESPSRRLLFSCAWAIGAYVMLRVSMVLLGTGLFG